MADDPIEFESDAYRAAFDKALKAKVLEALADGRPPLPTEAVRAAMNLHYKERLKRAA